jgi:galactitol-specific phosphotransferase system IIB component
MSANRLILCVCGGGMNTSMNAENRIVEYLRKAKRHDVEVKHAMIGDILTYKGRENMVVVWMTKIDPTFGMPAVQGLPFMIGSRQAKEELVEQIMKKLDEIYVP